MNHDDLLALEKEDRELSRFGLAIALAFAAFTIAIVALCVALVLVFGR